MTNPWLGASPDGLVHDPTSDPPGGLVEFKNYTVRNMTLDEALSKVKSFCLCYGSTQELQLKDKHNYYYQMHAVCRALHKSQVV